MGNNSYIMSFEHWLHITPGHQSYYFYRDQNSHFMSLLKNWNHNKKEWFHRFDLNCQVSELFQICSYELSQLWTCCWIYWWVSWFVTHISKKIKYKLPASFNLLLTIYELKCPGKLFTICSLVDNKHTV